MLKPPELLSPAGSPKHLRYAFAFGADAVYAGLPRYSLRVRNNDFDSLEAVADGIAQAHAAGKKFFLTANILPHNSKVRTFVADLDPAMRLKPDGVILADPGLIALTREQWPDIPVHLSVQANTMNYAAVRFWQGVGVTRIILSRELALEEVEAIRQACPDMELEVFVHGALCIAYSGRCLLSGYFNHRDPNQGTCTNSCRWEYSVTPDAADPTAAQPRAGDRAHMPLVLTESTRPDQPMPIEEDEHGTYILNSKDLRAVEHVQRLVKIGVNSLKIEGRTKSFYYVARTAQVYRQAIDDAVAGREFDPSLLGVLEGLVNRGYTDGFYQRHHDHEYQLYMTKQSNTEKQQFVAEVLSYDSESRLAEVLTKNKLTTGDHVELISPGGNRSFQLTRMIDQEGATLGEAAGSGRPVRIAVPGPVIAPSLLAKFLPARAAKRVENAH